MNKRNSGLISYFHGLTTKKPGVCFDTCCPPCVVQGSQCSCDSVLLSSMTRLLWCLGRDKPDAALAGPTAALVRRFDSWKRSEEQLLAVEWESETRRPKSVVTPRARASLLSQNARANQQRPSL